MAAWVSWTRSWAGCSLEGVSLRLDRWPSIVVQDWPGWRVEEGGLAPWPSPKPVSPQHLETITGTMIAVQTWLLGSALRRSVLKAEEWRATPPAPTSPPVFALAPAYVTPDGPSCQEPSALSCRHGG